MMITIAKRASFFISRFKSDHDYNKKKDGMKKKSKKVVSSHPLKKI